jgi:hypothetical protein
MFELERKREDRVKRQVIVVDISDENGPNYEQPLQLARGSWNSALA